MIYGIKKYEVLQGNLCEAGTTIMLCRANLEGTNLSKKEKEELLWRIQCNITELENMLLEIIYPPDRKKTC